ncbi:MAG TPA: class I SAM-dependent methyltransferase [Vicinamibacterales bacterium]|nr:class I SAM-dependent methyltransferase [Vicinamibacterales bacterium]
MKPAAWLVDNLDVLPRGGVALDVASGSGRHAIFLAARGWRVHAVDRDAAALEELRRVGQVGQVGQITTECMDLESGVARLGEGCYDAVVVFNYLHRPLMPAIVRAVRDGGVLIYETFTVGQARRGRPRNPAFLLQEGELPGLVAPLRIIRSREEEYDGKLVASVVAVRD